MPDFDSIVSELAADHGLATSKAKRDSDLDAIAKQLADDHDIKHDIPETAPKRVYVFTNPAPPISYATPEQSNAINAEIAAKPTYTGGPQTGDVLPPTDVSDSIYRNFIGGRDLATSGLNDISTGKPYVGAAKGLGGAALMALSPMSGAVEGGIEKPVTEITGNPDIGSRAGFVVSSALPIKLPLISKVANPSKVVQALPKNKAFDTLVESIGSDNVGNVAREMRANPRLTPADLSPATKQTVQKLFVTEGDKTKNYLANTVEGRLQSAKSAVEDAFTGAMGRAIDPSVKLKQLSDNIKAVGATQINPVLKATKPVDLTPVIEHIDSVLKPGITHVISNPESMLPYDKVQKTLQSFKDQITNDKGVTLTSPDILNKLQSGLRRTAEGLMRTPNSEDKAVGYALYGLRNKIIDAIDKAGEKPGAYREALGKYRDENNIATAFEHGHDAIIKNSKNLEDHPSFFKNWVNGATKEELEAAREGARVAIDTQMNGFKSAARRGTDIGQADFNHQRIDALFGKEEADKLFTKLEHERKIAETNSDLIKGSQTAQRLSADSRIALPTKQDVLKSAIPTAAMEAANFFAGGYPGIGAATLASAKGASFVKHEIATKLAKEHNANYAKLALPVEGTAEREELIKALEATANRQKPSMLSKASSAARLFGP